jgi:hypothetical protein
MEFSDHHGGDDRCRRVGHGSGDRNEPDSGCFGSHNRVDDSHGDCRDTGIDSGDAGESFNWQGRNGAVHGDRNFLGQFDAKLDQRSDMEFGDRVGGNDHSGRVGHWSGNRNEPDSGYVGFR